MPGVTREFQPLKVPVSGLFCRDFCNSPDATECDRFLLNASGCFRGGQIRILDLCAGVGALNTVRLQNRGVLRWQRWRCLQMLTTRLVIPRWCGRWLAGEDRVVPSPAFAPGDTFIRPSNQPTPF